MASPPGRWLRPKMQDATFLQGLWLPAAPPFRSILDHPPWDRLPVLLSGSVGSGHAPSRTSKHPRPTVTSPLVLNTVDSADSLGHRLGGKCSLSAIVFATTSSFCSCCPRRPWPRRQHHWAPLPPCSRFSGFPKRPGESPRSDLCLLSCGAYSAAATPRRPEWGALCDHATWRNWGSPETSCATSRTAVSRGLWLDKGP